MGFYDRHILPRVIHLSCGLGPQMRQRERVIPRATGIVLEVGIGSGLNLGFYEPARVERVIGLDPSPEITRIARKAAAHMPFPVEIIASPVEQAPLADASVDSVVMTYTLCSISDPDAALRQIARVLKPGGELIFCEHGLAPDASVRRWQHRLTPVWRYLGGGCHLDRDIPHLLAAGGLIVDELTADYIPGWRPAAFNYWGTARAA